MGAKRERKFHGVRESTLNSFYESVKASKDKSINTDTLRKAVMKDVPDANENFALEVLKLHAMANGKAITYTGRGISYEEFTCEAIDGKRGTRESFINSGYYFCKKLGKYVPAYSERIEFLFDKSKGVDPKEPLLGVEYECEFFDGDDRRQNYFHEIRDEFCSDLGSDFIFKVDRDGCSRGPAFELVSQPTTLDIHRERWPLMLNNPKFKEHVTKAIVDKTDHRNGIHIHLNRSSFSDLQLGKFCYFINNEKNFSLIEIVAGRKLTTQQRHENDYPNYYQVRPEQLDIDKIEGNLFRTGNAHSGTKHSAVNLSKKDTVEVRIFRTYADTEGMFACIEFVHALHKYSRIYSRFRLASGDFANWVLNTGNSKEYPNLVAVLMKAAGTVTIKGTFDKLQEKGLSTPITPDKEVKKAEAAVAAKRKAELAKKREELRKARELLKTRAKRSASVLKMIAGEGLISKEDEATLTALLADEVRRG